MFVVAVHSAFAEVDGGVAAAGTLTTVDEVKASQTSAAARTVEFSHSPLGLNGRKQSRLKETVSGNVYNNKQNISVSIS